MQNFSEYPLSVLLVDDDTEILNVLEDSAKMQGMHPFLAKGATNAIEVLKSQTIEVVVSDINMPEGDGLELIKWMKANGRGQIPFIFMTGFSDYSMEELKIYGSVETLFKPISIKMLWDKVFEHAKAAAKGRKTDRKISKNEKEFVLFYPSEFVSLQMDLVLHKVMDDNSDCPVNVLELNEKSLLIELPAVLVPPLHNIEATLSFRTDVEEISLKLLGTITRSSFSTDEYSCLFVVTDEKSLQALEKAKGFMKAEQFRVNQLLKVSKN